MFYKILYWVSCFFRFYFLYIFFYIVILSAVEEFRPSSPPVIARRAVNKPDVAIHTTLFFFHSYKDYLYMFFLCDALSSERDNIKRSLIIIERTQTDRRSRQRTKKRWGRFSPSYFANSKVSKRLARSRPTPRHARVC